MGTTLTAAKTLSLLDIWTTKEENGMFEGIRFFEICKEEDNGDDVILVAVKDSTACERLKMDNLVRSKVEEMEAGDTMASAVSQALDSLGVEYEIVYPDHYITI